MEGGRTINIYSSFVAPYNSRTVRTVNSRSEGGS